MTYQDVGVIATLLLSLLVIWFTTTAWAVYDTIKKKKYIWTLISLIPFAGAFAYYMYAYGEKSSPLAKLTGLILNRWTIIALIVIMTLGVSVRLADYRWPYLRNIDSYVFYRWIDETVQNDGVLPTDDIYQMAPDGFYRPPEWLYPYFYLSAYSYILVSKFFTVQLWEFLVPFPALLATLAAIPVYFIGKILYDRKAGVIASFIFIFTVDTMARSLGGDPDNDSIILLTSMATMAAIIFTYKYAGTVKAVTKKLVLYSMLTGVMLCVWYSTWAGYWYIFWLATGFIVLGLLFSVVSTRSIGKGFQASKYILISFAIYMAVSFALTFPSYGDTKLTSALAGPIQFQSIKGEDNQFPNVYVSVAELQQSGGPADIIQRTSVLGGPFILISPFFLMIYTLAYLLYSYYKKKQHLDTVLLLLVWFLGPFSATLVAVRFSTLFSAPMAVGSGILLSKIIRMTTGEDKSFGD